MVVALTGVVVYVCDGARDGIDTSLALHEAYESRAVGTNDDT